MSLLLEALKKAALEKQNRAEQSPQVEPPTPAETTSPSLGDTLQQSDDIAPVAEPEAQAKGSEEISDKVEALDPENEDAFLLDDANEVAEELEEQNADNFIHTTDALEDDSAQQPEEELLFEPEYEETQHQDDLSTQNHVEDIDEVSYHEHETDEPAAATSTRTEDIIDEAEIAAAKQQLEQEQILAQRRIEEEQAREDERQRVIKAAEEERIRQEEAEKKRAADIAAQERRRQTTQNRQALDQLISSGEAIRKKAKRRSAFLYSLLIFTAIGGLSAYYVFLIANTGKTELQVTSPIVETTDNTADVAELIQMTPDPNLDGELFEDSSNQRLSGDARSSAEDEIMEVIADSAAAATDNEGTMLAGDVTPASPSASAPTTAGTTNNRSAATATQGNGTIQVATRVDPPPSVTAYLQPLILSSNGQAQTENIAERVIVHHKGQPTEASELVREAFNALQANQIEKADRIYQQVLRQNPDLRDALLGAAATATSLGNFNQAMKHYQQRLAAAPNDTYARAGLLGLASSATSRASIQSELNALLVENPQSAQLHFVKGVSLASANEWRNAQSAFYEAYSLDNKNPDYAFNLAVSLDHLRQPSLARVYYERALQLGSNRKTHFEFAAAERRISELSQ
jgi:Flp pilus assembly protein TadD